MQAISTHQVVIVCGETGSGKTTQLPKMALALGRGKLHAPPGTRGRLIGHTQPRRIAATSVAKRIADELKTPLGEVVGYKVRFQDRLSHQASIKLMTDGILLAETQNDPLLKAYDTIIIDEAHERSLNIDFLLGYLREILPRRPDLKIIVTSATIDADRFAQYFTSAKGPAPVLMVSGRMFPVEMRWRPFEEKKDHDLNDSIADAVDELWAGQVGGDILIFFPGEREIREAADHLRQHLSHQAITQNVEVLPLFARLSQTEQERVFEAHGHARIVLATNVAETSLTVPGIRYVIDVGTARVKRYSYRSKVEQLLVEPISQAAANQRAGRCGRVANGICIRLYDEKDFQSRTAFTDPEILRSSLAGVILRMKALHLGDVEQFAFLESPKSKAITDGYQLLSELGAVDDHNELTSIGKELAKLPLDPRVGRMILEAKNRQALSEVLIIASALSVQDVRERPLEQQAAADQAHAKFKDDKSEFNSFVRLWNWISQARGGANGTHQLSNRQYENLLKQNFINVRRLREWRDVYSQLLTVVTEHKWPINTNPAKDEQLHLSLLCGLLGNIGCKHEEEEVYVGARGIKFYKHPGVHLKKKPGRWIVCAELVETTRLFGRCIANIDPKWFEQVGGHLLRKQLLDPHWEKKQGDVIALERATLYGLMVYNGRKVSYSTVDPVGAREIFIREALVNGEWQTRLPFLAANQKTVLQVEEIEHKSRRQDVLVDDSLIQGFYEQQIPSHVFNATTLEKWHREEMRERRSRGNRTDPLILTREALMRHEAAGVTTQAFPKTVKLGGVDCSVSYLHEPGDAKDGMTVIIPLFVLNQVSEDATQWLVPGMLNAKILAMLKSLPQKPRARLVPLPDSTQKMTERLSQPDIMGKGSLTDAVWTEVKKITELDVKRSDFKLDTLSPHHLMNFRVVDDQGRQLGQGRSFGAIKAQLGSQARGAFQALASLKSQALSTPPQEISVQNSVHKAQVFQKNTSAHVSFLKADEKYTAWDFAQLDEMMEIKKGNQTFIGFPALVDQSDGVVIEFFDEPTMAKVMHQQGLRRLFALQIKDAIKYLEKNLPDLQKMSVIYMSLGTLDDLKKQILDLALDRTFLMSPWPTDQQEFQQRLDDGRGRLTLIANELARQASLILNEYALVARKIKDTKAQPDAVQDCADQLKRLIGKKFLMETPAQQLQHLVRYLKAIVMRIDKLRTDPSRDATRMSELKPLEQKFWRLWADRKGVTDERMSEFRWLLEELRVSLYAQELRTPQPVSIKRLEKAWLQLVH